jgi:hypothetical protein
MTTNNKNIGSDFDDFLREEGILEYCMVTALLIVYNQVGSSLKTALIALKTTDDKDNYTHEEIFDDLHFTQDNEEQLVTASCLSMELADLLDGFLLETEKETSLKFHESALHATYSKEVADSICKEIDNEIGE